jgi:ATP-dependent RNA helicase A
LVRQLYHLGVIEAFTGTLKRPKEAETVKPFETNIEPKLLEDIHSVLQELGIAPKVSFGSCYKIDETFKAD